MKKKMVTLCLVVALVLTAVAGGTLAYFIDDDAKTNTFTVGNVDIHIDEWMDLDKNGAWEEYADQTLTPIAQSKAPFNKMVQTVNDGSEDAYIRTFVTCPTDMYWKLGLGFNSGSASKVVTNEDGTKVYNVTWKDAGTFMINGEETSVFVCEVADKFALKTGDSVLSLTKVWLYESVTNKDVESFDLTNGAFEVKVASQAIQAANLTYDEAMAELGAIDQNLMDTLFNNAE